MKRYKIIFEQPLYTVLLIQSMILISGISYSTDSSADVVIISIVFAGVFAVFVTSLIVFRFALFVSFILSHVS